MSLPPLPSTGFKPRHTAAPWTARNTDLGDGALWITGKPNDQKAAPLIAIVATGNPDQEANALLLADAPTLLYELRNLLDAITHADQTKDFAKNH